MGGYSRHKVNLVLVTEKAAYMYKPISCALSLEDVSLSLSLFLVAIAIRLSVMWQKTLCLWLIDWYTVELLNKIVCVYLYMYVHYSTKH